jgi:hypothetical protein
VQRTDPSRDGELIVDYDAANEVVGVELLSLGPNIFRALTDFAQANDLDLSALLAHSFTKSPAA